MSLRVGDVVPDFELPDETGSPRKLSEFLAKGPTVVFFYPKASSPVCTVQACQFRDLGAQFQALAQEKGWGSVQRVGISKDSVAGQAGFVSGRSLDFPLLSDRDATAATAFGVKGGLFGISPVQRATFVLDQTGTVLKAFHSEFRGKAHADEALAFLKTHAASA
ncbi:MAG: peroxiredoxin [Segniliparus sp.]|uniref:peroxiredoxin n=1 Tax=Segniliparus sp. TaxID=2804064 RepID=UPI003F3FC382